jgi:hypothetical protein
MNSVWVQIVDLGTLGIPAHLYYQGTQAVGFRATPVYRPTAMTGDPSGIVTWIYPSLGEEIPAWQNGHRYSVSVHSIDNSGNIETPDIAASFTYDANAPASVVEGPAAGQYLLAFSSVTGTYVEPDPPSESGLAQLQIAVNNGLGFWDGAGFHGYDKDKSWLPLSTGAANSFVYSDPALTANLHDVGVPVTYTLYTYGKDSAGNESRTKTFQPVSGGSAFTIRVSDPRLGRVLDQYEGDPDRQPGPHPLLGRQRVEPR